MDGERAPIGASQRLSMGSMPAFGRAVNQSGIDRRQAGLKPCVPPLERRYGRYINGIVTVLSIRSLNHSMSRTTGVGNAGSFT
jgi:hypothetical protein